MLAGLEHISAGDIHFGDRRVNDLLPEDRDIAMVFENYALYPTRQYSITSETPKLAKLIHPLFSRKSKKLLKCWRSSIYFNANQWSFQENRSRGLQLGVRLFGSRSFFSLMNQLLTWMPLSHMRGELKILQRKNCVNHGLRDS